VIFQICNPMATIHDIAVFLEQFAPAQLAEEWDNVGLLVGDRSREAKKAMTCLTVTPASAAEAVEEKADLLVTHHPLPFTALKRLTTDTTAGRLLWDLIAARISIYSPHTSFDSAREGVNQRLAVGLGLRGIQPLKTKGTGTELRSEPVPLRSEPVPLGASPVPLGAGRWGWLAEPLALEELGRRLKEFLHIKRLHSVGDPERPIRTVAVACGAADELLDAAQANGCDCLVIGEARFHTCLEAEASGIAMLLPGHFASERFAVECLAEVLAQQFPQLKIWASRRDCDPLRWM
jgi:dinuclear metal center YbgI/SA1388 family protein